MFGSQMLDIATALVLVFLMVSLMLTALQELIEAFLKKRARYLHDAIAQMLNDPTKADDALAEFYKLPSIFSLFVGDYDPKYKSNLPSYIPRDMFSQAILWMSSKNMLVGKSPAVQMLDHLKDQGIDLAQQQAELERWYDAVMERVSGQYKRNAQKWLLGLGVGVAVTLNINPIAIVTHLRQDPVALSKMVTLAERVHTAAQEAAQDKVGPASDSGGTGEAGDGESPTPPPADTPSDPNEAAPEPKSAKADAESTTPPPETVPCASSATDWSSLSACQSALAEAGIPLGWSQAAKERTFPAHYPRPKSTKQRLFDVVTAIVGWLITGLAASLGAPFWFDALGKIMTVRSTLKPNDAAGTRLEPGSFPPGPVKAPSAARAVPRVATPTNPTAADDGAVG